MQIVAKRNLVLTTVSSFNQLGEIYHTADQEKLYQQIAFAIIQGGYRKRLADIGNKLIGMADHALALRQTNIVERISEILTNAPLPSEYHNIGQYYQALGITRRGDYVASNAILEQLSDSPATPFKYRARALKAIGGNCLDLGNLKESSRFFLEACHAASP